MLPENNNQSQLSAFFQEEYQALVGYIKSRIKNTADTNAQDILQDVALKIFSRPENALPINNIPGFVYRTLKNRIIDKMRTKREPTYDENELNQLWTDFAERFYGTERNRYPKYLVNELKTTIMQLKPHYRDIILAIDFEGYSYREISEETGIPEVTLMSRRHRAMSILLKQIRNKHNV